MNNLHRIFIALAVCLAGFAANAQTSLKDAYKDAFKMGVAIGRMQISGRVPQATDLVLQHFNSISPENDMKPEVIHPNPDTWNFGPADDYCKFGRDHGLHVHAHTLVWHNQTPDFFWNHADGTTKSHDELVETMRSYIETVCKHFNGKVDSWDVLNEVIGEYGEYRDKGWIHAFGGDGELVARLAFQFAQQYCDPDIELYYNDFNAWRPAKVDGICKMVEMLRANGIRIDGIGIQGHWGLNYPKTEYIEQAIERYSALGLKVMITELDVDVLPVTKEAQVFGQSLSDPMYQLEEFMEFLNPYKDGLPDEVEDQHAQRYAELFQIFYKYRDKIDRVTLWGLQDGNSWKNGYPVARRTNYPLLFKRDYSPHKALDAVLRVPSEAQRVIPRLQ